MFGFSPLWVVWPCAPVAAWLQTTDLLHPSAAAEKRKHKLKRLVQAPNSFFMDVRCPGCLAM